MQRRECPGRRRLSGNGDTPGRQGSSETTQTLGTIYVTGTHIRDVDLETQHPLLVMKREDLQRTGLTDIAQIVQAIVVNGQTQNRGGWTAQWNGRFTLGVRNAFDRSPPVSYSAAANSFFPDYDIPGRFWWLSYRQRFRPESGFAGPG